MEDLVDAPNVYVSCTRLVVRPRALPAFLRAVKDVERQLRHVDGLLGGLRRVLAPTTNGAALVSGTPS